MFSYTHLDVEESGSERSQQVSLLLLKDLGAPILNHFDVVQDLLVHILQTVHAVVPLHPRHLARLLDDAQKQLSRIAKARRTGILCLYRVPMYVGVLLMYALWTEAGNPTVMEKCPETRF